ncbi:MAG: protoheme IX farnesyltransferase [Thermoplasmata archaeon]
MGFVDYIKLGKLKESLLLVFAGAAGGAVVNGIYTKYFQIYIYSLIMLFIAVMGTNSITNYIDKDIDSIMERTRKRPLPSGRINPPEKAIYYGSILILISIVGFLLIKRYYSIIWLIFGITFDPFLYNYLTKRKTVYNILIGSFAGGAPVMVIYSSVSNKFFSLIPFLIMITIVVWTPLHIWSLAIRYYDDYKKANVPMLPVKYGEKFTTKIMIIFLMILLLDSILFFYFYFISLLIFIIIIDIIIAVPTIYLYFKPNKNISFLIFKLSSPYLALFLSLIILTSILK